MINEYYNQLKTKVKLGNNVFIAPNATVIGNVSLGDNVSVWYGAVLRADFDAITIGSRTNIQEGVIMHVDPYAPINIGENVIIGHGAIIHGASVGDACLIGMRATVMNHAKIGKGCIIGAHTLVTENMKIPDFSMVLGTPAKIVKTLPPEVQERIKLGAEEYVKEAKKYLETNH